MICKWCGATIDVSNRKCSVCGREIPALSDCGGFYNIVPTERKTAVYRTESEQTQGKPSDIHRQRYNKKPENTTLLPCVSILLTTILGIMMMITLISISKRLDWVERRISTGSIAQTAETENVIQPNTVGESIVQIESTEKPMEETKPNLNMGDSEFKVIFPESGERPICEDSGLGVEIIAQESRNESHVEAWYENEMLWSALMSYDSDNNCVQFSFWLDKSRFGLFDIEPELIWKYMTDNGMVQEDSERMETTAEDRYVYALPEDFTESEARERQFVIKFMRTDGSTVKFIFNNWKLDPQGIRATENNELYEGQ